MSELRHAGIVTRDMTESLAFWRDRLGFTLVSSEWEHGAFIDALFQGENVNLEVFKLQDGNGVVVELLKPDFWRDRVDRTPFAVLTTVGLTHMAVTVKSLDALGVVGQVNPQGTARVAFVRDPNGVMVELVEEVKGVTWVRWSETDASLSDGLAPQSAPARQTGQPDYLAYTYDPARVPFTNYPNRLARWIHEEVIWSSELRRRWWFDTRFPRFLDLGCGRGEYLNAFWREGYDTFGVDRSMEGQKYTARPIFDGDVQFELPDIIGRGSFHIAWSKSVIEHCRAPGNHLALMADALQPGGIAIVLTPAWEYHGWGPFYSDHTHVTPFTKPSLAMALKLAGFRDVAVRYFVQLPAVWRHSWLRPLVWLTRWLQLPYRPWNDRAPWPTWLNTWIRFSKEVMLLGVGTR